ncbi:MAG: nucleotide exchange factor GrpE [Ruminococcus sp.]|jgi:molecular chaperone GrpE|nr:nucleotide exchange factor GrpE [Ruminococcus sp.]
MDEEIMENGELEEELADDIAADTDNEEKSSESETDTLKKQLGEARDNYLRLAAEYDNFRKRSVRDKVAAVASSRASDIKEFISVTDNLRRAAEAQCSDEKYKKGVEMTAAQFDGVLEKLGVKEIPAQGEVFDPNVHNAINFREDENFGDNTVCEVVQKGYMLEDKLIRPALVIVANP